MFSPQNNCFRGGPTIESGIPVVRNGGAMFDQLIDGVRKASESSLQMQQEMFRHWTRLFTAPGQEAAAQADWGRGSQKRWLEQGLEMLNRHREALDAIYKSGIQIIEQTFHVAEAKSADDVRPQSACAAASCPGAANSRVQCRNISCCICNEDSDALRTPSIN